MTDQPLAKMAQVEFRERFGRSSRLYRAPGRVNLVGEHTDYNGGLVMPLNLALHTWVSIAPRGDRKVAAVAARFGESAFFDLDAIEPRNDGSWPEYVKGVLWALEGAGYALPGADVLIQGDIPIGSGLSSSASLENAVAIAFLEAGGYRMPPEAIAQICQVAENEFVGMQCGIMDQFVIAACPRAHAIMLDCASLEYSPVALPARMALLVIDSGVKHSHAQGAYNLRRAECDGAFERLQPIETHALGLCQVSMNTIDSQRKILGDVLHRRARHARSEHLRVMEARDAMADEDLETLGGLLCASHASLRDDFEVSCSEVDELVRIAQSHPHVLGARMVGGGFGGCTINLLERRHVDVVVRDVCEAYSEQLGRSPWHHLVDATGPAGEVGA